MGISLYGLTPATTYDALIKTGDNEPLTASLKVLSDGVGTNLPMEASTTGINFTGALQQSGVAVPTASQVAAKQDTLVSGTNIKTINGTSVLGSGNIVTPTTSPSGVSGAIQFSNGSAFASDASNLFWDDTNNRLGVGTNAPTATGHFQSVGDQLFLTNSNDIYTYLKFSANGGFLSMIFGDGSGNINYLNNYAGGMWASNKFAFGPSYFTPSGQVHIKGSGSTSATTSLLVQNSAGLSSLQVTDDGSVFNYGKNAITTNTAFGRLALIANTTGSSNTSFGYQALFSNTLGSNNTSIGSRSLASNTSGDANTALGYQALFSNGSGSANVAVGQNALQGNTTGSNNVALGLNALFVTTGSSNTAVGNQSGNTITSGTGNLCLGFNAQPSSATANNECCFGSATVNAGAVSTESNSSSKVWNVIINGVAQKILLA